MSRIVLHHGDNRDHLRRLIARGVRVQSVVTDGPYGLVSIAKRFGKEGAAPAKFGTDGAFARSSGGFMGSVWDASGIERDPDFWRLIHDILLPGGYVLAFSSPRTGHWQACAMEMAGFIMHPFIAWAYGQGFPKAHNAAKAITAVERTGGAAPKNMRQVRMGDDYAPTGQEDYRLGRAFSGGMADDDRATDLTEAAQQWEGWAYGTQSLKPAIEPIYMGQKPFSEKNGALNILKHGVGALNIDGCRVPPTGETIHVPQGDPSKRAGTVGSDLGISRSSVEAFQAAQRASVEKTMSLGRHPANLIHDGSDVITALFPETPGQLARASTADDTRNNQNVYGEMKRGSDGAEPRGDQGSAARFFNSFPPAENDPRIILYHPKATAADRIFQCLICEQHSVGAKPACGCVGEDDKPRLRSHPTVKPIGLMEHLVRMVTPPGGTCLDPFAGSGTTGQAALNEGFDCILMEAEDAYAADIRSRFNLPCPIALPPALAALLGAPEPDLTELIG